MQHLMKHPGVVFTSERLLKEVWGYPAGAGSTDLVRAHIRNIRAKVEPDPADPIYRDHFPDRPVVPGSLIVEAFLRIARAVGFLDRGIVIENFRFREFLVPGVYDYRIEIQDDTLQCSLSSQNRKLVTGSLRS